MWQARIQSQLGAITDEELGQRKRALFDDFINASNQRLLFRDTIIESVYDPLAAHQYNLHYATRDLKDPMKAALVKVRILCFQAGLNITAQLIHHRCLCLRTNKKRLFNTPKLKCLLLHYLI